MLTQKYAQAAKGTKYYYCCGLTLSKRAKRQLKTVSYSEAHEPTKSCPPRGHQPPQALTNPIPAVLTHWGRTIENANMHTHTFLARLLRYASLTTCTNHENTRYIITCYIRCMCHSTKWLARPHGILDSNPAKTDHVGHAERYSILSDPSTPSQKKQVTWIDRATACSQELGTNKKNALPIQAHQLCSKTFRALSYPREVSGPALSMCLVPSPCTMGLPKCNT